VSHNQTTVLIPLVEEQGKPALIREVNTHRPFYNKKHSANVDDAQYVGVKPGDPGRSNTFRSRCRLPALEAVDALQEFFQWQSCSAGGFHYKHSGSHHEYLMAHLCNPDFRQLDLDHNELSSCGLGMALSLLLATIHKTPRHHHFMATGCFPVGKVAGDSIETVEDVVEKLEGLFSWHDEKAQVGHVYHLFLPLSNKPENTKSEEYEWLLKLRARRVHVYFPQSVSDLYKNYLKDNLCKTPYGKEHHSLENGDGANVDCCQQRIDMSVGDKANALKSGVGIGDTIQRTLFESIFLRGGAVVLALGLMISLALQLWAWHVWKSVSITYHKDEHHSALITYSQPDGAGKEYPSQPINKVIENTLTLCIDDGESLYGRYHASEPVYMRAVVIDAKPSVMVRDLFYYEEGTAGYKELSKEEPSLYEMGRPLTFNYIQDEKQYPGYQYSVVQASRDPFESRERVEERLTAHLKSLLAVSKTEGIQPESESYTQAANTIIDQLETPGGLEYYFSFINVRSVGQGVLTTRFYSQKAKDSLVQSPYYELEKPCRLPNIKGIE